MTISSKEGSQKHRKNKQRAQEGTGEMRECQERQGGISGTHSRCSIHAGSRRRPGREARGGRESLRAEATAQPPGSCPSPQGPGRPSSCLDWSQDKGALSWAWHGLAGGKGLPLSAVSGAEDGGVGAPPGL